MMVGRLPLYVRNFLKKLPTEKRPKFSFITIDDDKLIHMQRTAKTRIPSGQALSVDEILDIPNILKSGYARWYWDNKLENIAVIDDCVTEPKKVVLIPIGLKSDNKTAYILTSEKIDKELEKDKKRFIRIQ